MSSRHSRAIDEAVQAAAHGTAHIRLRRAGLAWQRRQLEYDRAVYRLSRAKRAVERARHRQHRAIDRERVAAVRVRRILRYVERTKKRSDPVAGERPSY